jgi:hypothetical protein
LIEVQGIRVKVTEREKRSGLEMAGEKGGGPDRKSVWRVWVGGREKGKAKLFRSNLEKISRVRNWRLEESDWKQKRRINEEKKRIEDGNMGGVSSEDSETERGGNYVVVDSGGRVVVDERNGGVDF